MNLIDWHQENLAYRSFVHPCSLNIRGESETVGLSLESGRETTLHITRAGKPNLKVFLYNLDMISENLYYFEHDGVNAVLFIPGTRQEQDDEE